MAIAGLRGTGDWGTDERPKNFREMILWLNANGNTPLTGLMARMSKDTTDDPEFSWWEETLDVARIQLNDGTGMTTADTAFVVDNGTNGMTAEDLKIGDLLLVEEGVETTAFAYEVIEVTAITSATAFSASRGRAGTAAAALTDDTFMTLIGSAYEEGSAAATATTTNPTKFNNFTQIFKNTYEITNTARKTHARTGDPVTNDKKRKTFHHARNMEEAWFLGSRFETTGAAGKPLRYTGGLSFFLALPTVDRAIIRSGAYANMNAFFDDVFDVFDFTAEGSSGGDERIVMCGNGALNVVNKLAQADGTINYKEIVEVFGMKLTRFVMPQGTFFFKSHPLLNRHPRYTNAMYILNPPALTYRPLRGRDTKSEDNIQTPGTDALKGQWLTEAGIEWHHVETMKYIGNIT